MSAVEATGKTVEEALEKALIELGRSKDEVTYEVLEAPSRGFFEPDASRRLHLFEAPAGTPLFMAAIYADDGRLLGGGIIEKTFYKGKRQDI